MLSDDYTDKERQVIYCAQTKLVGFAYPKGVPPSMKEAANIVRGFLDASIKNDSLVLWMRDNERGGHE